MSGLLCMQGGHEFTEDCREMDALVLARVSDGPIVVLAGAARSGSDYAAASTRAVAHYASLDTEVTVIPDPRDDLRGALEAMTDDLSLVILPGGSPSNLRDVLAGDVEARLRTLHEGGTAISGASAGAMVLCERMVRPGAATGADVIDGLGLVPGLALPHWSATGTRNWPVPDDVELWGLPECGGVLLAPGADPVAVGHGDPSRHVDGEWTRLPRP